MFSKNMATRILIVTFTLILLLASRQAEAGIVSPTASVAHSVKLSDTSDLSQPSSPIAQVDASSEVIWQIGEFDGSKDEFFPPESVDTDFTCDDLPLGNSGTIGNFIVGVTPDDMFAAEISSPNASSSDRRFLHSCNSVTIEFELPDDTSYSDAVLEYARMGGEKDAIYFDGSLVGFVGSQAEDPLPSTTYSLALGGITSGTHTLRIEGQDRTACVRGLDCINGLSVGFHWVDALRLLGVSDQISSAESRIWQIGTHDNSKNEFYPASSRDTDFVCDSVSSGSPATEGNFIVGMTPIDRLPGEIRSSDSSRTNIRGLHSCNSVTIEFNVPDGIHYENAVLQYARMGGEEDNILLDGDLVGSAGPQDIDPFDSTTFSLALGDISQGKHSIRIVSQSRSLCIGGINCENDLADGYHWVDALKLSGDANCPTAISGDPGAPAITNVDWALRPNNNLIVEFDVDVDSSSEVWIEYQAVYGEDGVLKTHPTPMSSNSHHLDVMRLLADTEYCFQVFARNDAGQVSDSMQGSFRTGPLPAELASSSFRLVSGVPTSYPLTLLNHQTGDFDGIVAVDSRANVVWYQDGHNAGDIVQDPDNYNLLFISGQVIKEIAPTGELVHESPDVCSIPLSDPSTQGIQGGAHHEVLPPDGDLVMYLGWVIKDPFNDPERLQRGDTIRQWNRQTGEDVQIWDPFEFLDPFNDRTESSNFPSRGMGCDGNTPNEDWTHSNSLQVVPAGNARPEEDDNILMSVRDVNEIISIEPDLSGIAWRLGDATQLGNSTSDFTFPNPDDQFYRQHSARQLPNGNILLFDNGTLRPASEGGEYSRALELELDMQNMTATKVWEYRHNPDLFSRIVSNVNRLENGNTVVVFGADQSTDECCRIFTLVEADDQPEANALTVIEISAPGKSLQYRVHPVQTLSGEEEK